MVQDPRLKDIFPVPPLVAYKRPPNIKEKLIRAKVPKINSYKPRRNLPGMKKCLNCSVCPFVSVGKTVKSTANNTKIDINTSVSCTISNVVYLIGCKKCTQQYIGETERTVKERFLEHKGMWPQEPWVRPQGDTSMRGDTVSVIWHLLFWRKFSTKTPNIENKERRYGSPSTKLNIEVSTESMEAEIASCNCF